MTIKTGRPQDNAVQTERQQSSSSPDIPEVPGQERLLVHGVKADFLDTHWL